VPAAFLLILGQVTGYAQTASAATEAFIWSNGTMTDLGTFGLDPVARRSTTMA
jgi:probable HAF family extracellular repeat protein